jgi:hypothetical protein
MRTIQIRKPKSAAPRPEPDVRTPSGRILPY